MSGYVAYSISSSIVRFNIEFGFIELIFHANSKLIFVSTAMALKFPYTYGM